MYSSFLTNLDICRDEMEQAYNKNPFPPSVNSSYTSVSAPDRPATMSIKVIGQRERKKIFFKHLNLFAVKFDS
ncbi:unnamed protein product [Larinioides sclopetarius]|uniref:Uncharacterized protein n=1 Tax=Larinioides sclopetarius TaxID=280406 RepID=A0AAV1ZQG4_9ARAC